MPSLPRKGAAEVAVRWENLLGETGSPIESDWLRAFCEESVAHGYRIGHHASPSARDEAQPALIVVIPQKVTGRYILDFAIYFWFRDAMFYLAVECDGHAFHHKTSEQVERDNRRQQMLAATGWRVLRFSGREINADPRRCAMMALDMLMDWQTSRLVAAVKACGR